MWGEGGGNGGGQIVLDTLGCDDKKNRRNRERSTLVKRGCRVGFQGGDPLT